MQYGFRQDDQMRTLFKLIFVGILSLVIFAGSAHAQTIGFSLLKDGVTQFSTPMNIGCTYIPFDGANGIDTGQNSSELHCYRLNDKRGAVSLGVKGKARGLIVKGALDCCTGGNVLAYGKRWAAGGYSCTSKRDGLSCARGKHGFVLTTRSIKLY
jgi:hypothetical protein